MSENMTVNRLLAICEAPDVQAAMVQGDKLGWQRLTDAKTEEWRTHFGYNGGSGEAVGWRQENADQTYSFSFWVAVGPNGHKVCTYQAARPLGLLESLSAHLGPPDTLAKEDALEMISA